MAMHQTTHHKNDDKNKEFKIARLSEYVNNPSRILLEQTVSQKAPLMDLFDEMFGQGGYSGAAF